MATGIGGFVKGSPQEKQLLLQLFQKDPTGKLVFVGQGGAPMLDPGAQRFVRRYGSPYAAQPTSQPVSSDAGVTDAGGSGLDLSGLLNALKGSSTKKQSSFTGSNIATNDPSKYYKAYTPGGQESLLNQYFREALTGKDRFGASGNPVAQTLFSLAQGKLPDPLTNLITSQTNDQFGKLGARFGTDLANATSRGLGEASAQQALAAQGLLANIGSTTSGQELTANQNALDRALKQSESGLDRALSEYLAKLQNDPTLSLLKVLLGSGLNVAG